MRGIIRVWHFDFCSRLLALTLRQYNSYQIGRTENFSCVTKLGFGITQKASVH